MGGFALLTPYPTGTGGGGGTTILDGSGPPADALGSAGDYYIDIDTGIMYGPKAVASVGVTENILDGSIPVSTASGVESHGGDFNILLSGTAVGARFWRNAGSGLTSRNLVLYNAATGVTLATATTTAEAGSGWITAMFPTPVSLVAPVTVAVIAEVSGTWDFNNTAPTITDPTHATWVTGRYGIGGGPLFPTSVYPTNYFVDLLWALAGPPVWPIAINGGALAIGSPITSATAGSVLFAGAAGVLAQDNTNFFWDDALNDLHIGGTYYIGGVARAVYRVHNSSGDNWFEGDAGNLSTTGYNNFGTGFTSLLNVTTGYENVALGAKALFTLTTGYQNTALGSRSLYSVTVAHDNTTMGAEALGSTTSDFDNIGIGKRSLYNLGAGGLGGGLNHGNIAIGDTSYINLGRGTGNIGIGFAAGAAMTATDNAIGNTLIGYSSGFTMGGGSDMHLNTCVGYFSAANLTGGSIRNVWVGGFQGPSASVSNTICLSDGYPFAALDFSFTTNNVWSMSRRQLINAPVGLHIYGAQDAIGSTTNYERGCLDWNLTSNVFRFASQAGGTGVVRLIAIDGFAKAGAPAAGDLPSGSFAVIDDTSGGATWLVFNKAGTIQKGSIDMSNPVSFINSYTQNIVQFCQLMQTLRGNNDQLEQDPSLIDRYFDTTNPGNPNITVVRTDITAEDVHAAEAAIVQLLFAYDSGNPTNKSALFKMLP